MTTQEPQYLCVTKFSTVRGASLPKSSTVKLPLVVFKICYHTKITPKSM